MAKISTCLGKFSGCWLSFSSLKHAPRELWIIYALKFLESYAYFSMSVNYVLYLSSDQFGYTDIEAGTHFGVWGVLISVYGLATGILIDGIGVKWSMVVGAVANTAGRGLFAVATERWHLNVASFVLMPIGMSLGIPVLTIGIKQCTDERNRSVSYGLFYAFMNVAAMISGEITDSFNSLFGEGVDVGGAKFLPMSMVFLTSTLATILYGLVALFVYRSKYARDLDYALEALDKPMGKCARCCFSLCGCTVASFRAKFCCCSSTLKSSSGAVSRDHHTLNAAGRYVSLKEIDEALDLTQTAGPATTTTTAAAAAVLESQQRPTNRGDCGRCFAASIVGPTKSAFNDRLFWQLMLFSAIMTGVNLVFRHMDATFPKYIVRAIGPNAPYGTLYSINPLMIIFMVPISQAVLSKYDAYKCITVGSFVAALSVLFLCLQNDGSYWSSVCFIVALSIGEAIYSPRVYEYTMLIAPKGHEGLYTMLSSAPMFAAKLVVGVMSGFLLEEFCPLNPPRRCAIMWLVVAATSIVSPLLLVACRRCIHTDRVKLRIKEQSIASNQETIERKRRKKGRRAANARRRYSATSKSLHRTAAVGGDDDDDDSSEYYYDDKEEGVKLDNELVEAKLRSDPKFTIGDEEGEEEDDYFKVASQSWEPGQSGAAPHPFAAAQQPSKEDLQHMAARILEDSPGDSVASTRDHLLQPQDTDVLPKG